MIRKGSIDGLMIEVAGDAGLLELALEDYALAKRRERASRRDFVAGWLAAHRRSTAPTGFRRAQVRNEVKEKLTVAA